MTLSRLLLIVLYIQVVVQVLSEELLAPPAPPQNIHVDNWLLTWTATEERDVTYTVQYRSFDTDNWKDVPACIQISLNSCNVTLLKPEEYDCVMLRVRAERHLLTTGPVEACSRHGGSCTPEVSLTARPGSLTVYLSRNHSLALEHGGHAMYRVYYGKKGEPLQKFKDDVSSVSFNELQEGQHYCTKVQYIYFNKPFGLPSCTQCVVIPESRKNLKQTEILVVVVAVIILVILVPVIAYILIFQRGRIKQWLRPPYEIPDDFLNTFHVHHNPISTSSSSEEHWDVISCITPEEVRE
ncbi:interferon gamma receptor 2 [Siniperca chuatsi]|uniref:Cytokine receptor family B6 n=1 Tax=Siniperca chuatsi TaxID=119488 RepID=A0A516AFI3_SINCH|nr:interferon gamma receptor 2 [Siniperca chuatsi]QDO15119.1 cytokine receptor family B6 [Siniperca chuatsi]